MAWAAAAAAIVAIVVVTVVVLGVLAPSDLPTGATAPAPAGTLSIDAVPWAEVVEITDSRGETLPLPADRFTPLRLSLPEGRYRIALRRPEAAETLMIDTEVSAGQTAHRLERFDTLDADAFLAKYGL